MLCSEYEIKLYERREHMERSISPKIGEVYLMNFGGTESEQSGWRPGLIFQNNIGNEYSPNVIALPLTTSLKSQNSQLTL